MRITVRGAAIAAAVAIGMSGGLAKADPPMRATGTTEPAMPNVHDGGYVGLTAGINSANLKAPEGPTLGDDGYFGGAYIGVGATYSGTYMGIELDAMLRDVKPAITDGITTVSMSNRWMGSLRGRIGMPIGPALLYGTGGIALQEAVLQVNDPLISASSGEYVFGLVGGAGLEVLLTRTVSLRVEGLHYAWRDQTFTIAGEQAKIGQSDTVFRVGVGFKLQ